MNTSSSFENEHIKLSVERHPECKVVFSITTLPLPTKAAEKAAIKSVSKEVNVPGFRKGRAPEDLIEKQFPKEIKKEFLDILTRNSLNEAITLSGIHPLNKDTSLKLLKCDPIDDSSYLVSVEFESYPSIPSIDPKKLTIKEQTPQEVTEEQIDAHIHQLQLHHATWDEITDRAAQDGDFVTLDIDLIDQKLPTPAHRDSRFELKEGRLPQWLYRALLGLSIGSSTTGISEAEEPTENFIPKTFNITLKKIEKPNLHPLDDALAKKAGVDNVALLKEAIHKSLEKDARDVAAQKTRFEMKKALLEAFWFEVPGTRIKQASQECREIAESEKGKTKEEREIYSRELLEKAHESMRFSFLLSKILYENRLPIPTTTEIRQRATEDLLKRYMQEGKNASESDLEYYIRKAENELIAETALDFLIESGKNS